MIHSQRVTDSRRQSDRPQFGEGGVAVMGVAVEGCRSKHLKQPEHTGAQTWRIMKAGPSRVFHLLHQGSPTFTIKRAIFGQKKICLTSETNVQTDGINVRVADSIREV